MTLFSEKTVPGKEGQATGLRVLSSEVSQMSMESEGLEFFWIRSDRKPCGLYTGMCLQTRK